jgi:hypothetical protein
MPPNGARVGTDELEEGTDELEEEGTARGVTVITGAKTGNMGLRPPAPSSEAPIGIPTRPTAAAEVMPVPDEADPAGCAKELPIAAQAPDAFPVRPPPSNAVVDTEGEVPAVDVPMPGDVPAIALPMVLPMPDDIPVPVTDDVAIAELAVAAVGLPRVPNDASAIEPPKPRHAGLVPVTNAVFGVIGGLMPGDPSCDAPRGMRVGGTGEPGPMPSGDVMPSGESIGEIPPTCAKAEPELNRTAAVVAITKRVIIGATALELFILDLISLGEE